MSTASSDISPTTLLVAGLVVSSVMLVPPAFSWTGGMAVADAEDGEAGGGVAVAVDILKEQMSRDIFITLVL